MSGNGGVEDGGGQAFVLGEQVVGELMKIADAADARRAGDNLIDIAGQLAQHADVFGVSLNEPVTRTPERRLLERPVFRKVVQADDLMTRLQQLFDKVAADEAGGAGNEDFHASRTAKSFSREPQASAGRGQRSPEARGHKTGGIFLGSWACW